METNLKGLGEYQRAMLEFARRSPGWNSFARDRQTLRTARSLERRGLIRINGFYQLCIASLD